MRIEQMQYIVEIARTGSISTAAERLNLTQPNVSQSILALEHELGVKLFKRSRSGTQPTEAGKSVVLKAEEILKQLDEIKNMANIHTNLLTGSLSIAAIPTFYMSLLPKTLAAFKLNYPRIELEMKENNSAQIIQMVLNETVDLGVVAVPEMHLDINKLRVESFLKSKVMACVGKNSAFAHQTSITMKEIIKHPVLSMSEYILKTLHKYGEPNLLFKANNMEASKHVIAEGLAIGFYTELALKFDPYYQTGELIPLRVSDEELELSFYSLQPKSHNSMAAQEFIKELRAQVVFLKRVYNL